MTHTSRPQNGFATALSVMILCGIAVFVYWRALGGAFVWDDMLLVAGNTRITGFQHLAAVLREDLFHMTDAATGYYRPVQVVSYMADYVLWGKTPLGYHLTNLVLQILNSLLVMYVCLLVSGRRRESFFAGALFAVHPAFVPIVAYVAGRADLLGMCFGLTAVSLVVRYLVAGGSAMRAWLAVPLYVMAVLSKELYLVMPLFAALYLIVWRPQEGRRRQALAVLVALGGVAIVYALLRATALNFHQSMGVMAAQSFFARLALFPWIVKNYIVMLLAPIGLSMEKQLIYASLLEPRFLLWWVMPPLFVFLGYRLYRSGDRLRLFYLGWFVIGIIPVSNLIMPLKTVWADHWAYLASVGFFGFLASCLSAVPGDEKRRWLRSAAAILAVCYLLFLAVITFREIGYWRNEEMLYARIMETSPGSGRTVYNQGKIHEERGDLEKALAQYTAAIDEYPDPKALYYNSRGLLYKRLGDPVRARKDFEAAVDRAPAVAVYRNNLGASYAEAGMLAEARRQWRKALEIDPDDELAAKNLRLIGER